MATAEDAEDKWRADHADEVRRAIKLIGPRKQHHHACREDVEMALVELDLDNHALGHDSRTRGKPAKLAAKRLALALRRVEVVLKDKDLDQSVYLFFPPARLQELAARCEEMAATPSGKLKRTNAEAKKLAIARAYYLLFKHCASDAVKDDATKGSRFCQLAELLHGQHEVDLHNQCRAFLRETRKRWGSK